MVGANSEMHSSHHRAYMPQQRSVMPSNFPQTRRGDVASDSSGGGSSGFARRKSSQNAKARVQPKSKFVMTTSKGAARKLLPSELVFNQPVQLTLNGARSSKKGQQQPTLSSEAHSLALARAVHLGTEDSIDETYNRRRKIMN